jgi:polysaccharide biosynthesis/export protein
MKRLAAVGVLPWIAAGLTGCAGFDLSSLLREPAPSPDTVAGGAAPLPWGAPPGSAVRAGTAVQDPAYRIGPEDGLEIAVWKDETLKSTVLVRPDGGISFPLVGELAVAGLTATQVRDQIVQRLARFVPDAEVTVSVVRVASYRIYVIGRVNRPGDFAVGRTIDVLQALSLAGGMTPFADDSEIRIIRREGGRQLSIPFDYRKLRKGSSADGSGGAGLSQNIQLRSGDVVLVP